MPMRTRRLCVLPPVLAGLAPRLQDLICEGTQHLRIDNSGEGAFCSGCTYVDFIS